MNENFFLQLEKEINKNEKYKNHIVFRNSGYVNSWESYKFEIYAGRAGAFKPKFVKIITLSDKKYKRLNSKSRIYIEKNQPIFEILDIHIMGSPQLISYQGSTIPQDRGLSSFFEEFIPVNWQIFGSSCGQGLEFNIRNTEEFPCCMYVMVYGEPADKSRICCFN